MFGVKDPIPRGLRTRVLYKFLCVDSNACYVGETPRYNFSCKHQNLSKLYSRFLKTIHLHLFDVQVLIFQAKLLCWRFGFT